jgi:rare lipoprotein A
MSMNHDRKNPLKFALVIVAAWGLAAAASVISLSAHAQSGGAASASPESSSLSPAAPLHLDRSGRSQHGKASFYAARYSGRAMADGTPMRLYSNNAASLTLPLGTTARVTNLQTGRSAVVTIRDRGPYVRGRIIDLSPATARQIGMSTRQGLASVEVKPLQIPLADGSVRIASLVR